MKFILFLLLFAITAFPLGARPSDGPIIAVSISPLRMLFQEIMAGRGKVIDIVKSGQSPHVFDPTPSVYRLVGKAEVLFYVSESVDPWATNLGVQNSVEVMNLLPEKFRLPAYGLVKDSPVDLYQDQKREHGKDHGDGHIHDHERFDPHFWTDPLTVNEIIGPLVNELCQLDGNGCPEYKKNGEIFKKRNIETHRKILRLMESSKSYAVIMFHPSFRYFFRRYGLKVAGVVELFPGREPGPKTIRELIKRVKHDNVRAICTEPQLPRKPAQVLAESVGLPLFESDPLGRDGESYADFLLRNAMVMNEAFR